MFETAGLVSAGMKACSEGMKKGNTSGLNTVRSLVQPINNLLFGLRIKDGSLSSLFSRSSDIVLHAHSEIPLRKPQTSSLSDG